MQHDRQKNDSMRDRDSGRSGMERGHSGDRMRNREESELERAQIEGNLGNERTRSDRPHDRDRK